MLYNFSGFLSVTSFITKLLLSKKGTQSEKRDQTSQLQPGSSQLRKRPEPRATSGRALPAPALATQQPSKFCEEVYFGTLPRLRENPFQERYRRMCEGLESPLENLTERRESVCRIRMTQSIRLSESESSLSRLFIHPRDVVEWYVHDVCCRECWEL